MRSILACVAAFASTALAHYNFEALIVNDNVTGAYEYVRKTTNSNFPVTDVTSQDFICNAGGLDADIMSKTSTYTVQAGDSVGFTINVNIGHPGPLHVYMSKAPDSTTAQNYKGDGDWFKVYSLTTSSITDEGLQWATYVDGGINNFTFALPQDLAAGEYLMRAEHIALHGATTAGTQYYLGCAQLKVEGSGTSTPTDTVSIPGVYDGKEPGILLNIYYPVPTNYTDPGPVTWPNSCEDHSGNFVGQTSDGDCTGSTSNSSSSGSSSTTGSGSTTSSSSSGSASTTGSGSGPDSGSGSSNTAAPSASGSGSSPTGSPALAAEGADSASSSSSSSSGSDSCASQRKKRMAKRAAKHGLGIMRD